MFVTIVQSVRRRMVAHRDYRRTIAEIEAMTRKELAELRVYGADLQAAARQDFLQR